ncbi:hypothetical protein BJ684DRAFT_15647 [Piptocephalis cylindrospora]|uniref:Uncharacterized protein n=1 Tax=Piptocephalis cylindrospora TaxID=1907219 RepID=A0A4P9Y7S9_9FUNG|nr:hypothetical protein BJ684DRAFT_15647 [Piptocephalis cylindrospora]|eukprot:RKP14000.1 hypothetical protein BJ684DRAFT_15647 [Piptocephalis cylindrospora]
MRTTSSFILATATYGAFLLSEGVSGLSAAGSIIPFADDVIDTSAACTTTLKSLPSLFPNLRKCHPVSGLSMASPAAACGLELTQPSDCLDITIRASQRIAASCHTDSKTANATNIIAPYTSHDVYRNWSNRKATNSACAKYDNRPCLNVLTDMVMTVLNHDSKRPMSEISDKICQSKCASSYYLAVNGFSDLAPTVYLAESVRLTLFDAFRSTCSWARDVSKATEKDWLKQEGYDQCADLASKL